MFKTKIVEKIVRFELFLTVIGQLYVKVTNRKTFQNKIFPELNSKKHTHCHQPFDFYEIAELHKT